MTAHRIRLALVFVAAALVAACGGDSDGGSAGQVLSPVAWIAATPTSGPAPLAVRVDGSGSASSGATIVSHRWSFGDDTPLVSGVTADHVYVSPGTYTVTLWVSDSRGGTGSTTREITVTGVGQTGAVAGNLLVPSTSRSDGDVNDPTAPYRSNDTLALAQAVPGAVVVGGYLNEPGRGPTGRSYAAGDLDDFYRADLAAGQVVELVLPSADPSLPDSQRDDADLDLYDANGQLIDSSLGVGQVEQLTVPANGVYHIRVSLYSGAPLYRLSLGQASVTSTVDALRLSDEFVPGEVLVTLDAGGSTVAARQKVSAELEDELRLRRKAGDVSREMLMAVPEQAGEVIAVQGAARGAAKVAGVAAAGTEVPAELRRKLETLQYVKLLRGRAEVRAADLNRIVRPVLIPDDPGYVVQRWHYEQISLPAAWNVTTGSADVVIAVVDSGVVSHPELVANLFDGYDFIRSALNQDGDGIDADPDDPGCALGGGSVFHGTHVAGTVAAASNNASGVAGVAWNARLMPVRVLDGCTGSGTFYDVAQGIRYAAGLANDSGRLPSQPADVINLSLGATGACDATSAALFAEVRARGVAVVAAAGNENTSALATPASCPNVIAVSAVGPTRQKASYSNFGATWVDVAAPGGELRLDADGDGRADGIFSTHASGGGADRFPTFDLLQGTSMATPHVAGVLALMKSVNAALTPAGIDTLLAQGLLTDDIGPAGPDELGVGLVNAFKAVQAAGANPPVLPPTLAVTPSSLNFGDVGTRAEVVVANGGGGTLTVTGTSTSAGWLRAAAASVDADGLGSYAITVERGALGPGTYSGWVDFASSAGTRRLAVLMQVAIAAGVADAGNQYVLLLDPATEDSLEQVEVRALGERAPYRFDAVPAGDYLLVAGTDMNNDGFICDDGEACGAWPVESRLETITVSGDRLGLDFSTSYSTSLQPAAAEMGTQPFSQRSGKKGLRPR
jgi:serine protease